MSLIAHYKLEGNANDSSGYSFDGSPVDITYTDGKLGQCGVFNGSTSRIVLGTGVDLFPLPNFSISTWFKSAGTTATTGTSPGLCGFTYGIRLFVYDDRVQFGLDNGTSFTYLTSPTTYNFYTDNQWHHVVATATGSERNLYIDGEHVGSLSDTWLGETRWPTNALNIGQDNNNTNYHFTGEIDDFRIYDHALSQKEVKELSKAKVLHYKFDDFQEPTENIFPRDSHSLAFISAYDGTSYGFGSATNIQQVIDNTLQRDDRASVTKVSRINSGVSQRTYVSLNLNSPLNVTKVVSFWYLGTYGSVIRPYNNDGSASLYYLDSGGNWVGGGTAVNIPVSEDVWQKITVKIENNGTTAGTGWSWLVLHNDVGTPALDNTEHWLFTMFQSEEKSHATPFTVGTRAGVIADSSTQDNITTLELSQTPKWVTDSKLGAGAYHLDGSGTIDGVIPGSNIPVTEALTNTNNYPEGCTYSFWINVDTNAVDRMSMLWGSGTIRHIEIYSTGKYFRTEAATQNGYSFGSGTFPDDVRGQWAHFAIVFANGEATRPVRWYQNGTLFHTGSMDGGTNPGGEYFSFSRIGRSTGSGTYLYAPSFDGRVDDFRIYGTALSASDIEELAQTRASLDDTGSMHTLAINETKHSPLLLDYTTWTNGTTGSESGFSRNGADAENHRVLGPDPWGKETVIWEARPDATSGADGGWNATTIPVDNTKMYRLSTWVKRNNSTNGNFYLGCHGYGSVDGVLRRDNNNNNTNPYFLSTAGGFNPGEWQLVVGHIWPAGSGTGAEHPDSGRYTVSDGRIGNISLDFVWRAETTTGRHRSYLYYSTDTSMRQQWVYPRMEIVDGTEPSIADLLAGVDSRNIDYVRSKGGTSNISLDVTDQKTNLGTMSEMGPTGGLVAYYPLDGNANDYSDGNDGSIGGTVAWVIGKAGQAAQMNTGSITFPDSIDDNYSFSFWVKLKSGYTGSYRKFLQKSSNRSPGFWFHSTSNRLHLRQVTVTNSNLGADTTTSLTVGEWYHITFSCEAVNGSTTLTSYLNGSLETTVTEGSLPVITGSSIELLSQDYDIDGLRIYDRALSSEEISILYSMTGTDQTKMKQTRDTLYVKGEFKETY